MHIAHALNKRICRRRPERDHELWVADVVTVVDSSQRWLLSTVNFDDASHEMRRPAHTHTLAYLRSFMNKILRIYYVFFKTRYSTPTITLLINKLFSLISTSRYNLIR